MTAKIIDPRVLRDAFGAFATGVTVVTASDAAGRPIGFTANSFSSVSLDPPLLLVCVAKTSRNYATMTGAARFAINVLSETQKEVSNTFARPVQDRFAAVDWWRGPSGCPIFSDVAAWFECSMQDIIDAGDHVIMIGRVIAFENSGLNGLGYVRGGYFTPRLAGKAVSAAVEGEIRLGAVLEQHGSVFLLGDEILSLPNCTVQGGDPARTLAAHLDQLTGLKVTIGFLYSVYEDKSDGRQHIVYHALASEGAPREGRFLRAAEIAAAWFSSSATADIINRFVLESSIGNFGMYFGDETGGTVHPTVKKGARS
ncbi:MULTISPECIES: flavin reductase family protein [Rhizobium]|uniref:Flavin reductase domain-containing FMN-binding protein n=1 Tax=Rhizobium favelukesii TaxID=348824 RepID=W6RJP9_9HYPH|nr:MULTISPECIES: flavin reductase family protein [Rhizobium]MCA0806019.1 flavin reductase family protein [Rhizobium sp. T1473]MCS0463371.1 flavin reductase family protein [Rhizobium favelukesii]UFS84831.1 flavin reductase family protein [Rhizobium sp. T136]CDM60510.1 flavin reductase domain-containing FMN-binding protein [Rhizobium favelukesii]